MSRHTKIVATLGPASSDLLTLERMVHAGLDVVRMNFSHGKPEDHVARAETIRDASARAGRPIGILADLQGPKIRVGKFEEGRVTLTRDAPFILDARCELGNAQRVGLDYKDLPKDVKPGDVLLLDDGRLKLTVQRVVGLARQIYERFETTPLDLFEVDDAVILRLRHDAVHRGEWRTRLGTFDVAGKPVSWEALVLFRLRGDRIVEERVFRDELGMLLQVGAVEPV